MIDLTRCNSNKLNISPKAQQFPNMFSSVPVENSNTSHNGLGESNIGVGFKSALNSMCWL